MLARSSLLHFFVVASLALVACTPARDANTPDPVEAAAKSEARTFPIEFDRPAVNGERVRVSHQRRKLLTNTTTLGGQRDQKEKLESLSMVAIRTTREVNEDGNITVVDYELEELLAHEARGPKHLAEAGVRFRITRGATEDEGKLEVQEGELGEEAEAAVRLLVALRIHNPEDSAAVKPAKHMPVGGRWNPDAGKLGTLLFPSDSELRHDQLRSQFEVLAKVEKESTECLEIEGVVTAEITPTDELPEGMSERHGTLEVRLWGLFPIDTSKPQVAHRESTKLSMVSKGVVDGRALLIDVVLETTKSTKFEALDSGE